MTQIDIRPAIPGDLPAILALYSELESPDFRPDLGEALAALNEMRRYPNYVVYVLASETEIVGTFALLIMVNIAHRGAPSGIVEDVVIHPKWQGLGLGKVMMRWAMDACRRAGCYKLVLSSNQKREAAHRFYESLGFERHGFSFSVALSSDDDHAVARSAAPVSMEDAPEISSVQGWPAGESTQAKPHAHQ